MCRGRGGPLRQPKQPRQPQNQNPRPQQAAAAAESMQNQAQNLAEVVSIFKIEAQPN